MKRLLALAVAIAIAIAFLVGYWPEHERAATLQAEVDTLTARVADLEARNRAAGLLGDLLNVTDAATRKDYGQAQQLSSAFFDHVRTEMTSSPIPALQSGLPAILAGRDAVTSALARGDEQVLETLRGMEMQLRTMLGYPTMPAQG
jgi:hypothetical protein